MKYSLPENSAHSDPKYTEPGRPIEYSHSLRASSVGMPVYNTVSSSSLSGSFRKPLVNPNVKIMLNTDGAPLDEGIPVNPDIYPTIPDDFINPEPVNVRPNNSSPAPGSGVTPGPMTRPNNASPVPGSGVAPGTMPRPNNGSPVPGSGVAPGSMTRPNTTSPVPGSGIAPGTMPRPNNGSPVPGSGVAPGTMPRPNNGSPVPGSGVAPGTMTRPNNGSPVPGSTPGSMTRPNNASPIPGSGVAPGSMTRPNNASPVPGSGVAPGTMTRPNNASPVPGSGVAPGTMPRPNNASPVPGSGAMPGLTRPNNAPIVPGSGAMPGSMFPNMPNNMNNPANGGVMRPNTGAFPNGMAPGSGPLDELQTQSASRKGTSPCQRGCDKKQNPPLYPIENNSAMMPEYYNDNVGVPCNQYHMPMGVPLMPLYGYDNCEDADKDLDYMKQMYPLTAKKIIIEIDEECDKLEYDGSCMFDEYPDKIYLGRIIDRIYEKCKYLEEEFMNTENETIPSEDWEVDMEVTPYQYGYNWRAGYSYNPNHPFRPNQPVYRPYSREPWVRNLIEVLLYNEMLNRRRRYRGRKRWF